MKVSELLASEACWAKRAFARNAAGDPVNIHAADAVSFCLNGAIQRCYPNFAPVMHLVRAALSDSIGIWNDQKATHRDVVKLAESLGI